KRNVPRRRRPAGGAGSRGVGRAAISCLTGFPWRHTRGARSRNARRGAVARRSRRCAREARAAAHAGGSGRLGVAPARDPRSAMSRGAALVSIALLAAATIGGQATAASTGDGTDAIRAALAAQAWGRAESLAVAALAHARTSEDSADLIARVLVARWRNDRERTPGTLALAERALAIRLRAPGRDSIALAIACEGHAYGLAGSGRAREADEPAYRALGIRQRAAARAGGPASDVDMVRLRHLLGVLASHRRDYAE